MIIAVVLLGSALTGAGAAPPSTPDEPVRNLVFLAEERPVFLRLRVTLEDQPFDAGWLGSVELLSAALDRDGDGVLTTKEASAEVLAAVVRLATAGAASLPRGAVDRSGDGVVSVEELADAVRPALGPFRVQIGRLAVNRTDALFDHLDRDKDGQLTRSELAAVAGTLRRLDLDDDEMISAGELEPFQSPAAMALAGTAADRQARFTALPPVVELVPGESSLRLARLLLKKYDKGGGVVVGRPDGKLSSEEFAVDAEAFSEADSNRDESLNTDELRKYVAAGPCDLELEVALAPPVAGGEESARAATPRVRSDRSLPKDVQVRQLTGGDVEIAVGRVRLDLHVEDGAATTAAAAQRGLKRRFKAADANKDGYLEGDELAGLNAAGSPLAGLTTLIDRDGDGKLYEKELLDFAERQTAAAQSRLSLAVSDQGRAIFGILDLDRDRRLSAREVLRTVDRITSWDGDRDGRVTADEIPYHFLATLTRGELSGLSDGGAAVAAAAATTTRSPTASAGPAWFRQMDRNHDGDVSHREFLGPRAHFDRLDRDQDGLIDADEAAAETGRK